MLGDKNSDTRAGPSPGFSSRGSPKSRRGQKAEGWAKNQKGGLHFKNTALDVCSNQEAKREMGGSGTTKPPLATALYTGHVYTVCNYSRPAGFPPLPYGHQSLLLGT